MQRSALVLALICACPGIVAAQEAANLDAQHAVFNNVPPKLMGVPGQALEKLQAMKPEEFETIKQNAAKGDASAEAYVCVAYRTGHFVRQDASQALSYCKMGAAQSDPLALEELGMMYLNGPSDFRDAGEAIKWLSKAADLGSTSAMDNLGSLYANGSGVLQDYSQALQLYRKALDGGFIPAEYDLGVVYLKGEGVQADSKQGLEWITKAANAGFPYAVFLTGMVYESGFGSVKPDLKQARAWFERGAAVNEMHCEDQLGWMYANGVGVKRDYSAAAKWYRASAEQNDPVGAYGLGVRYMKGQGVEPDGAQAVTWFQKAAEAGHADAAFNLAMMLANQIPGHSGPPDFSSAAKYLAIAAAQDISDGQCALGLFYAQGFGVKQDDVTAYKWILLSQRGSHLCDQDRPALQARMTPAQIDEATQQAQGFKPLRSSINYGNYVPPN